LALTAFPKGIWRQIWSSNPISVNRPSEDTSLLVA
jgi:putative transposase